MMEFAESQAIRNRWVALGMAIREDVRGIEKFEVSESADRAASLVCANYSNPKTGLMEALLGYPCDVGSSGISNVGHEVWNVRDRCVFQVHGHGERQGRRVVPDDEHRPHRHVLASNDAEEVDQWNPTPHHQS